MVILTSSKKDEPIYIHGYRLTFIRDNSGEIIGVLIEGPRLGRPVYIPKSSPVKAKLPETIKKALKKEGFNVE
ncbi:MAG: hypothetical protein QW604_04150 [Fervidicoccaceae archaeon]|jgi:hypothetical protein|nr:hypothetical protein [Fervidicoccaceae archaeon]